jgi:hypothetical protein
MARERQIRIVGASPWLVLAIALGAAAPGWSADPKPGALPPRPGVRGVVTRRAVVKFSDVVSRDRLLPVVPGQPGAVPEPEAGPIPDFPPMPVPTQEIGPMEPVPGPQVPSPATSASFLGLDDNNTTIPPDTQGTVGPNHLMVTLNSQVRIQTRAGATISTVSLNSFWAAVATGGGPVFDPRVLYDPFGNRWIVAATDDPQSVNSGVLIGVSQTSDPTGAWNLYQVKADGANLTWADFPSVGFNKNWIALQVNMFNISNNFFDHTQIYAFSKADLYAAGTGAFTLFTDNTIGATQAPAATYDNALATEYLLQTFSSSGGQLRLYQITGAVGSESFGAVGVVTSPQAWVPMPAGRADFAPQLLSANKIQNNDARMQRPVYRNGSIWAAHTIFLPAGTTTPTRASVQWWQISTAPAILQRGRIDDGTGATFYAFPSIAVNTNGDVLLGYSRFSATQFASGNYAFRASTDAVSTLRDDTVLKAGEASYFKTFGGGQNRWGDYSQTVVDPANDTDMWTLQEYAATPGGGFDRWGTWWGLIVPPATTNTPPSITAAGPLTRQQGSAGTASTIATVSDAETPAGSLVVTTTSVPAGLAVTGITNTAGTVIATVVATCAATLGANTVGLQVMDGGGLTATANLTVNVTANTAPVLGTYPATTVAPGGGAVVTPSAAPSDNGSVSTLSAAAPGFGGTFSGNAVTGAVTVANAPGGGNFTVTVTATDNCGTTATATFPLGVCGPGVTVVPDGRLGRTTIGTGATLVFGAFLRGGRSYSADFGNATGTGAAPGTLVAFQPGDGCVTGTLSTRDTTSIEPPTSAARRISFTAPADGLHRFGLANTTGAPVDVVFTISETTLLGPSWSSTGTFDTYFSFQNTTSSPVNGTLTLLDTGGATLVTSAISVPAGVTVGTNTAALAAPRNATGTVRFVHDGPPRALVVEGAIANFNLVPAYVQPVKFQTVREVR